MLGYCYVMNYREVMNSQVLYTKCFKHELTQHSLTLGESGLRKKYFFENPKKVIENYHLKRFSAVNGETVFFFVDFGFRAILKLS